MYLFNSLKPVALSIVCALIFVSLVQADVSKSKVWMQTTDDDFRQGKLDSVVVTRLKDGEVQLPHPLVKTGGDSIDDSIPLFAIYDHQGNYLILSNDENKLYAEKYDTDGRLLIERFQVNTDNIEKRIGSYTACFNDENHGFMILWSGQLQIEQTYEYWVFARIFDSTGKPVSPAQNVNEVVMGQSCKPTAVFDDFQTYRILWQQGNWDRNSIYFQQVTASGEKIGTNQLLNPEGAFKHEFYPLIVKNSRGELAVGWSTIVDQEPSSNFFDVYLRFFSADGTPTGPPVRVDDDPGENEQRLTDMCFDHQDNLLLVWIDRRDILDGNFAQLYAQSYNADRVPLNRNMQIAPVNPNHDGGLGPADIVLLPDGWFRVIWEGWHMGGPWTTQQLFSDWRIVKVKTGEFTSPIFDAGPGGADWQTLDWTAEGDSATTTIKYQIRSSQSADGIGTAQWIGPSGPADFYAAPQPVNPIQDGERYVQLRAFLSTDIPGTTPVLHDVSLWFTTLYSIAPQTPSDFSAQSGIHQIRLEWRLNHEPDLKGVRLYRGRESQNYDDCWTKEIPATQTSFIDTSVVPGETYFYAISAVDSNLNESRLSPEISGSPLGRHINVDARASAGGDGSAALPFTAISAGLSIACFGDTVNVRPGSYAESVIIGEGVALVGSGANLTKIIGSASMSTVLICQDSCLLKGFTIINYSNNCAIQCEQAAPLITDNVLINYNEQNGIGINLLRYSTPRIIKNVFSSFAIGIWAHYEELEPAPGLIRNNLFINSSSQAIRLRNSGVTILNNTIVQTGHIGIACDHSLGENLVMNNIIYSKNEQQGVGIRNDDGAITCTYNNIVAAEPYSRCQPGQGSISATPLFRQERPNDFRLQEDSPGMDAGNPAPEFNDCDGSRNDMGAFGGSDPIGESMLLEFATSVAVSNASGFPGDSIAVSVSLTNLGGVDRISFDLTFDEILLDAYEVTKTQNTDQFDLSWQDLPGKISVNLKNTSSIIKGSGAVATVHFAIAVASAAGKACPLSLETILVEDSESKPFRLLQITHGAFIVHLGSAGGQYVFVDQTNTGVEDGSRNHPFRTISSGILNASSGDTVLVAAGDYAERLLMRENIFVKGMGALVTRVYNEQSVVAFTGLTHSGLSGFTIETGSGGVSLIGCSRSSPTISKNKIICGEGMCVGIDCSNSPHPDIFNNYFQSKDDGIWIMCINSSPWIHHNTFQGDEIGLVGIDCDNESVPDVERNIFYGPNAGGAIIHSRQSSPRILGNMFFCGKNDGFVIQAFESIDVQICNNIFHIPDELGVGIWLRLSQDSKIINNTFYANQGSAIYGWESTWKNENNIYCGLNFKPFHNSDPPAVAYSDFWDYGTAVIDSLQGTSNIIANPQFVNLAEGNYRLAASSPCIDAGDPSPEFNDLDGSRNDMGAYGGPLADSSAFASQRASLAVSSADAAPGDLTILPVESHFIAGVAEIELTIRYDPSVLAIASVKTSDLTKSFSLTSDISNDDSVGIVLTSPVGIQSEQGALIQIAFKVKADADTGKSTAVSIKRAALRNEISKDVIVAEMQSGQISITGGTLVLSGQDSPSIPRDYELLQNYPNPFNYGTNIRYGIPNHKINTNVSIKIYNILGQLTRTLVCEKQSPGYYSIHWDGNDNTDHYVSSGIYLCVLKSNEVSRIRKMLVLK
ncbi:right-handed parallel beta-helix repeat-containing protein [candidate division KSB1 bacterium]|nr:right-handed parallel beta-helix repeat-containing protein [candidate division KSB1 bacterium]